MARVNYRDKAERTRNSYLYPENDKATTSDIVTPALEYLLFLTPFGRKATSFIGKQISKPIKKAFSKVATLGAKGKIKGAARGLAGRTTGMADRIAGDKSMAAYGAWWERGAAGRERATKGINNWINAKSKNVFDFTKSFGVNSQPAAVGAINFAGNNPGKIALGAGAFGALMAMAPRKGKQPIADIGGGYPQGTTWVRRDRQPMRPGHLGATGDLVFALRNGR